MRALRLLAATLALGSLASLLSAQTVAADTMGAALSMDSSTTPGTWRFSWWGRKGRHYLLQRSSDLMQPWTTMPGIAPRGADASLAYVELMSEDVPRVFFRVVEFDPASAPGTGNPLPELWELFHFGTTGVSLAGDPDGDDLSNLAEFRLGMNPTSAATRKTPALSGFLLFSP